MNLVAPIHGFLQRHQIGYYDPDNQHLRHAIHTALAVAIAVWAVHYWHWPEGAWLILTTVFVMQARLGETKLQCAAFVAVTGFLSSIGAYLGVLVTHHWWAVLLLLCSFSFLMVVVGFWGQRFAVAGFFVNLLTIISTGLTAHNPLQRVGLIWLGTLICLGVAFIPLTKTRYKLSAIRENFWRCCYSYWQIQTLSTLDAAKARVFRIHLFNSLTKVQPLASYEQQAAYSRIVELLIDINLLQQKIPQQAPWLMPMLTALNQQIAILLDPATIADKTAVLQQIATIKTAITQQTSLSANDAEFMDAWIGQVEHLVQIVVELKII